MRVAVYNRHWPTMGGGEKYGGGIAEALQDDHDVELVAHEAFDVETLAERLALDLHRTGLRIIGDELRAVTDASADYDLFINTSYLSNDVSVAPASIYVVHFPAPLVPDPPKWHKLFGWLVPTRVQSSAIEWGTGFYPATTGALRSMMWTDGEGELLVFRPVGTERSLELHFSRSRPVELGPAHVTIEVDGSEHQTVVVEPSTSRWWRPLRVSVPIPERDDGPTRVVLRSETFVPSELRGTDDKRQLGVPLSRITTRPSRPGGERRGPRTFVDSYTTIVSNAAFTQRFVHDWWGVESTIVYPPVSMKKPGEKAKVILSVGRFFAAQHGHSKKQLEMVRGFRKLYEGGLRDWELHLVGGCSEDGRAYLDLVRNEARGLPVIVHADASGAELGSLFATASIFWSLTGLGDDPRVHPGRFEHFGITTVEAMSAGVVPVVLGQGGQVEVVRNGVDGQLIRDLGGLVKATRTIALDPALRARMRESAIERAQYFAMPQFKERFRAVVDTTIDAAAQT